MNYIDLHLLVKSSNSKLLKSFPHFGITILEHIIKQNDLNHIINKYSDYEGVNFLPVIINEFRIKVEIEGLENLPKNGKCFFVSNHPFGFIDGLVLTSIVAENYGTLKSIGNEVFMLIPQLRPFITPVNVFGPNSRENIFKLENVLKSEIPVTHFPAGEVSRIKNGKVRDKEWHKSFVKKAIEHQRNIVPFYFYGYNSLLFYLIFITRKFLRIDINIELILLPRELFNKRNKTIKLKIGKPIQYSKFNRSQSHHYWAQFVRNEVYKLKSI